MSLPFVPDRLLGEDTSRLETSNCVTESRRREIEGTLFRIMFTNAINIIH
jgi:hypothetical protein